MLATVEAARGAVGVGHKAPTGTLRVTASASFGRLHLVPALKGFMAKYPELTIDFRFSDSIIDMVEGGFDVAVRLAELKDSSLVARKLAPDRRIVVASPEYLAQHGTPQSPEELVNHECVTLAGLENWVFETPEGQYSMRASGSFRTDNGDAMRDACIDGLGVSKLTRFGAYTNSYKKVS